MSEVSSIPDEPDESKKIKIRTGEECVSSFDVDGNVTAIYHEGVELLARIEKLESGIESQDQILGEIRAIQKTNIINNDKRRLVERGFAVAMTICLLVITALGSFGIDMARKQEASLERSEEKIDSLVAMGSSFEKSMGVNVGDTITVTVKPDADILSKLENVGSADNPRVRGRILAKNGSDYIVSHEDSQGRQIIKVRRPTDHLTILPDYR